MERKHDYIPRNDAHFNDWFKALTQYVNIKTAGAPPEWGHINAAARLEITEAYAVWYTAYAPTLQPHTPAITTEKNEVRKGVEHIVRAFVQRFLHWPPVTDADRVNMGIPNRDTIRTPHIEVGEVVEFELDLRNIREILVDFWVKGSTHKAKPHGYDGAVIVWDILDAPPPNPDALTHHTMASRTPHALVFDETQRGKTVYIACTWQNERGNTGLWSEIQSAIVP